MQASRAMRQAIRRTDISGTSSTTQRIDPPAPGSSNASSAGAAPASASATLRGVDRGRLEAFSDGVFAVAITLLALNLIVPGPGHGALAMQLGDRWPSFVAYLISFFTIGIIWVNHHEFVKNIAVIGRPLLFINLVLLLFVVLIPFATGTMAEYLTAGGQDAHVSMALFAGVYEGMGAAFGWLFLYTAAATPACRPTCPAPWSCASPSGRSPTWWPSCWRSSHL